MLDALAIGTSTTTGMTKMPKKAHDWATALKTAKEFEEVFVADAMKNMVQGISVDPLNPESNSGMETWRELLVDQYAKGMVSRGGIGLAEPMARELLNLQETDPV